MMLESAGSSLPLKRGVQPLGRIAVGGEQDPVRGHRAARRGQPVLAAGALPAGHRRVGVNDRPTSDRRTREAADVAQGMQAEIVRHHQAALRLRRVEQPLLHLRLAPELPALAEQPLRRGGGVLQLVPAAGAVGEVVFALACDLDVDRLFFGEAPYQGHAGLLGR